MISPTATLGRVNVVPFSLVPLVLTRSRSKMASFFRAMIVPSALIVRPATIGDGSFPVTRNLHGGVLLPPQIGKDLDADVVIHVS